MRREKRREGREGKISEAKVDRVKWERRRKRRDKNEEEKVIAVSGAQKITKE